MKRVKDTGSFNQFRSTGQNYFDSLGINTTTYPQTGGFELTVYNPFESVYTHVIKRSSGLGTSESNWEFAGFMLAETTSCRGIQAFTRGGETMVGLVQTFGIKI